jgi:hypothetical protein
MYMNTTHPSYREMLHELPENKLIYELQKDYVNFYDRERYARVCVCVFVCVCVCGVGAMMLCIHNVIQHTIPLYTTH